MGVPKHSRKGKKAWRKNIDATEIETFIEEQTHKERREPAVETLENEDLFVVDKTADDSAVPLAVRKRKREPKPLRSQLILDSLRDGVTPVPQGAKKKQKGPAKPLPHSTAAPGFDVVSITKGPAKKKQRRQKPGAKLTDIWADSDENKQLDWTTPASGEDLLRLGKQKQQQQATATAAAAQKASKKRKAAAPTLIPAVEIDMPGCSFNPEPEAHQDALAVAVAREYKKQLRQDLAPTAPSLHAPEGWKPADALDELLGDADGEDQDDELDQQQQQQQQLAVATVDKHAIAIDSEDEGLQGLVKSADIGAVGAAVAAGRKTKKDRNKEARRKQQEAEAAAKRALKTQRQDLDALPALQQQLEEELQEKEAMRLRRQVVQQEKAASQPPRLGKERFEAPAPAVLTSDELTGSLRQIKPCFMVTADRFKALQKRGLIEPRKPAGKKAGRKVEYVTGERREKAEERQQEIMEMQAARKRAVKTIAAGVGVAGAGAKGAKKTGKASIDPAMVMPLDVGATW